MSGAGNGNGHGARAGERTLRRVAMPADVGPALITGGAGFVGCNLADRLLRAGREVVVFDNLSRPGVERNLAWLKATHGDRVRAVVADLADAPALARAVRGAAEVYHFAAQVAVTTSLVDPVADFEVNARGTLNLLEALRRLDAPPPLVFTSTNKVYGDLADVPMAAAGERWEPADPAVAGAGMGEARPLDFHSPYGCSKGTADQYVLDYARSFGLRTVVFRMSCIYGPHQYGTEDQGWVAHFLIRALDGEPIVLYGDGRQVRDVLFVDDLVDAFLLARQHVDRIAGRAFNIGGGVGNTTSLLELVDRIGGLVGARPALVRQPWRTGDQKWYVSDVRAFGEATGWAPRTALADGLTRLHEWLRASRAAAVPTLDDLGIARTPSAAAASGARG
jgi:CDP-paratose 2-epimerase